jgi:hypothetical protein
MGIRKEEVKAHQKTHPSPEVNLHHTVDTVLARERKSSFFREPNAVAHAADISEAKAWQSLRRMRYVTVNFAVGR